MKYLVLAIFCLIGTKALAQESSKPTPEQAEAIWAMLVKSNDKETINFNKSVDKCHVEIKGLSTGELAFSIQSEHKKSKDSKFSPEISSAYFTLEAGILKNAIANAKIKPQTNPNIESQESITVNINIDPLHKLNGSAPLFTSILFVDNSNQLHLMSVEANYGDSPICIFDRPVITNSHSK